MRKRSIGNFSREFFTCINYKNRSIILSAPNGSTRVGFGVDPGSTRVTS